MLYTNLNKAPSFKPLQELAKNPPKLQSLLTPDRIKTYHICNDPLQFSYACSQVNPSIVSQLQMLSDEQNVISKYTSLLSGHHVNYSEHRSVLHHKTRSTNRGHYGDNQARIALFSQKIHAGVLCGYSNKKFTTVVQVGIGGSDQGPRVLYHALQRISKLKSQHFMDVHFIANLDPDDAYHTLDHIAFESTLFIIISKSGTTLETSANYQLIQQYAAQLNISPDQLRDHVVAVTGKGSQLDIPENFLDIFYIDDAIGGRFSSSSAAGGLLVSLAFGADVFDVFLQGAATLDRAALNPDIRKNMALLSALIGVWERNFLFYPTKAIIPYSEALYWLPQHLQQLDCESNGKHTNIYGERIDYETGPVIFGAIGTNAQHSFFQMLHQGTSIIPVQFIGFLQSQYSHSDISKLNQTRLKANLIAQITAMAMGQDSENHNKYFPGNRPSTLIVATHLTPRTLGALFSFYENTIMFQGFLWNINSFDQEGVQLGKVLANHMLDNTTPTDPILSAFSELFRA